MQRGQKADRKEEKARAKGGVAESQWEGQVMRGKCLFSEKQKGLLVEFAQQIYNRLPGQDLAQQIQTQGKDDSTERYW